MLYNPEWNKKPDVNSISSLINWLETQDPEKSYSYGSCTNCLLAQYYKAQGYWVINVTATHVQHGVHLTSLPQGFNSIALAGGFAGRTFGAALERAREVQAVGYC